METTKTGLVSLALLTALLAPIGAQAQPQAASGRSGQTFLVGDREVDVVMQWGPRSSVEVVSAGGRRTIHRGAPAYAFAAANDRGVLVALVGASVSVQVVFVPIGDGRPGAARPVDLARIAGGDRSPVGAAVAARPDGFAVFWQEASTTNPNQPYQTFVARLDAAGRVRGPSAAVPAPWPLADVMWLPDENRYYFLLFYGGQQMTRLCGVHVAETLQPQEHPWWATPPGEIDEARLARRGGRVVAVYRDGTTLRESDVTSGGWAQEPAPARSHGPITPRQSFALDGRRAGQLEVRARTPL